MTEAHAQILVNLSRLSADWALTHVSRFLPELVAARPRDRFVAIVPRGPASVAESWGLTTAARPPVRHADLVLSPLSHLPMPIRKPQILWACDLPVVDGTTRDGPRSLRVAMARLGAPRSTLVVYPTAAARRVGEAAGHKGSGLVVRPPVREQVPPATPEPTWRPGSTLRVLVPAEDLPGQNLELLSRVSFVLTQRRIRHQISVVGGLREQGRSAFLQGGFRLDRDSLADLRADVDVVLVPSVRHVYGAVSGEFERLGFPVAASRTDGHLELRQEAHVFDPASPHDAVDALLAAAGSPTSDVATEEGPEWRFMTPESYARAISAEIDRLLGGHKTPWAV